MKFDKGNILLNHPVTTVGARSAGGNAMTRKEKFTLITALLWVCGSAAATAQSYGPTGPGRANIPDPGWRQPGFIADSNYARGKRSHRVTRVAARPQAGQAAAKPDPAFAAQRNTALLMRDAMNTWGATSSTPAGRGAPRPRASQAAAKPDPALAAQRNTALLLAHAMNPWAASQQAAGTPARRARR
jgi:hypothetical protein